MMEKEEAGSTLKQKLHSKHTSIRRRKKTIRQDLFIVLIVQAMRCCKSKPITNLQGRELDEIRPYHYHKT